jgi:hypothetical protein
MKKRIFRSCTILVLGLAATQTIVPAQEAGETLEGVWIANVTGRDCQTGAPLPGIPFRALSLFSHDGSLTNEAAFFAPSPRRSSGLGAWRLTQGHVYTSTFRFFRYNPDGSFLAMRKITLTIELNGDQFTSMDVFEEFNADNVLVLTGCNTETATRVTVTGSVQIILPANVTLAPGDTVNFPVSLAAPAPANGVFISLTSSDTSKVTISPSAFFISQGLTMSVTPKVTGVNFGSATITASASGGGSASQQVTVK